MVLSVLISEQIISPLIILQSKIQKLELGKKYEKIEYQRKDEIGQLVDEYNKMVDKLDESIILLSKAERENAWRDMAKQIAHEIKNPLTPMKLSIQFLLRSWHNQDQDFDIRLKDLSVTLIEQIETLRRIAEDFSDFAKMPKPIEDVIVINDIIEQVVKLHENTEGVDIHTNFNNHKNIRIFADSKQITRVFINLIKNAIQAIPNGVKGKIVIDLDVYGDKTHIKVIDNGSGISEEAKVKLFVPSFTTKSSGMGLGLSMVKNIIDNARGNISFKSEIGKGTTFHLEFPLYKEV
jgi:nitrogen fixation/metabolism regulation signal transduction histidine kinase